MRFPFSKPKRVAPRTKRKPVTLKDLYNDAVTRELKKNPDLLKKIAFSELGHAADIAADDPIETRRKEVKQKLLDHAINRISKDPKTLDELADRELRNLVGDEDHSEDLDDNAYEGSPMRRVMDELDEYEALKERFGGGGSGLSGLITKDVVIELLKTLRGAQTQPQASKPQVQEVKYVVLVDGKTCLVSEHDFKALSDQGRITPIAGILPQTPKPQEPAPPPVQVDQVFEPSEPALPEILQNLDFEELIGLLDQPPDEVAQMLIGDVRGQLLISVLTGMTYQDVVTKLTPYQNHSSVGTYVQRIIAPETRPWAEAFLKAISGNEY